MFYPLYSFRYIVLTVIDQSSPDDALLGHVVIDLDNLDVAHGYRGSFPLADMVNFLNSTK